MDDNQEIIFLSGIIDEDNNNIGVELDKVIHLFAKVMKYQEITR